MTSTFQNELLLVLDCQRKSCAYFWRLESIVGQNSCRCALPAIHIGLHKLNPTSTSLGVNHEHLLARLGSRITLQDRALPIFQLLLTFLRDERKKFCHLA